MRQVLLDTETTGLDCNKGDRIVEIGCIEIIDGITAGETYHQYINPERAMSLEAANITGITDDFLSGMPKFSDVCDKWLDFIQNDMLIIHNAKFDIGFLNMELNRSDRREISSDRVIDTLELAKAKFPGAQVSLDALCRRFEIDLTNRAKHGALLDAELLLNVYIELNGGRQQKLFLPIDAKDESPKNIKRDISHIHKFPLRERSKIGKVEKELFFNIMQDINK